MYIYGERKEETVGVARFNVFYFRKLSVCLDLQQAIQYKHNKWLVIRVVNKHACAYYDNSTYSYDNQTHVCYKY